MSIYMPTGTEGPGYPPGIIPPTNPNAYWSGGAEQNTLGEGFVGKPNPDYPVWKPEHFFQEVWRNPGELGSSVWAGPNPPHTFQGVGNQAEAAILRKMEEMLNAGYKFTDLQYQPHTAAVMNALSAKQAQPTSTQMVAQGSSTPPEGTPQQSGSGYYYTNPETGATFYYDPAAAAGNPEGYQPLVVTGPAGFRHGGTVPDRANIPGGAEPIMAHEGETIMSPEATRQYGPQLERMNRSTQPRRSSQDGLDRIKRLILEFHRGVDPNYP